MTSFDLTFNQKCWTFLRNECEAPDYQPRRFTGYGPMQYYNHAYESSSRVRVYEDGKVEIRPFALRPDDRDILSKAISPRASIDLTTAQLRNRKWALPTGEPVTLSRTSVVAAYTKSVLTGLSDTAFFDELTGRLYIGQSAVATLVYQSVSARYPELIGCAAIHTGIRRKRDARAVTQKINKLLEVAKHRAFIEGWDDIESEHVFRQSIAQEPCLKDDVPAVLAPVAASTVPSSMEPPSVYHVGNCAYPAVRYLQNFDELAANYDGVLLQLLWADTQYKCDMRSRHAMTTAETLYALHATDYHLAPYLTLIQ